MKSHGIMFHHFYNDKHYKGQGAISADQLEHIIHYYSPDKILPAKEWFNKAINKSLESNDICLTFDDALLCQYEIALPVLEKYHLTAFWFVYTSVINGEIEKLEVYRKFRSTYFTSMEDFYEAFFSAVKKSIYGRDIELSLKDYAHENWKHFPFYSKNDTKFRYMRDTALGVTKYNHMMDTLMQEWNIDLDEFTSDLWMNAEHLKELNARGHIIGVHSHTHPTALAKLPISEQEKEYQLNYNFLSGILGERPTTMSHPCNSYTEKTLPILRGLGIQLGFRATMEDHHHSEFEFPREDHANILRELEK